MTPQPATWGDLPASLNTPAFIESLREWIEYRREQKFCTWKSITWKKQLTRLEKVGPDTAIEAIDNSIANGYQGIFPTVKPAPRDIKAEQAAQMRQSLIDAGCRPQGDAHV